MQYSPKLKRVMEDIKTILMATPLILSKIIDDDKKRSDGSARHQTKTHTCVL